MTDLAVSAAPGVESEVGPEVLVALSGGVDSSVAALLLRDAGYRVVGVTMKLWGGASDRGCCSVSDVDDARRTADQLGIEHHVFNFGDDFEAHVVGPYVAAHAAGLTPNPCIACNRYLKFDKLLRRAAALGISLVATGHHARVVTVPEGGRRVARGADSAKDQSYVLYMLGQAELARLLLPVGGLTKSEVRAIAAAAGLRTAAKPDSQDVCFVTASHGRRAFLESRLTLTPGQVVDVAGETLGAVDAVELVTVGQRKGFGATGAGTPRYVLAVDPGAATVTVGSAEDLLVERTSLHEVVWTAEPALSPTSLASLAPVPVLAQTSAHGLAAPAVFEPDRRDPSRGWLRWAEPHRRTARGQAIVLYARRPGGPDEVIGGALA